MLSWGSTLSNTELSEPFALNKFRARELYEVHLVVFFFLGKTQKSNSKPISLATPSLPRRAHRQKSTQDPDLVNLAEVGS